MTIIDASAPVPTPVELAEQAEQGPDYFAPGREVWSPALGCRARILAKHSEGEPAGTVHTLAGFVSDAIPVPMPGERLRGRGHFLGWEKPEDATSLVALVTHGVLLGRLVLDDPAEWDARKIVESDDPDPLTLKTALTLLSDESARNTWLETQTSERAAKARQEGRREAEAAAQDRLDALVRAAHEWADQHNQCEQFDVFCVEHNLPQREREYDVTVRVTLDVPVRLMVGRAEDDVSDAFAESYDEDDIWRMIRSGEIDPSDVIAYDVEVRDYSLA